MTVVEFSEVTLEDFSYPMEDSEDIRSSLLEHIGCSTTFEKAKLRTKAYLSDGTNIEIEPESYSISEGNVVVIEDSVVIAEV
jgi:GH15 family glucan-1,4-alpha-glucosidase